MKTADFDWFKKIFLHYHWEIWTKVCYRLFIKTLNNHINFSYGCERLLRECLLCFRWVAYSERCFTGQQCVLEKGCYPGLLDWGDGQSSARSLRPVHRVSPINWVCLCLIHDTLSLMSLNFSTGGLSDRGTQVSGTFALHVPLAIDANSSPLTHLFEIKIGHLWDLCRSNEKLFLVVLGGGGFYSTISTNSYL